MKTCRKFLCMFLALLILVSLLPASALAGGEAPTKITVSVDETKLTDCALVDGKLVGQKGCSFGMKAVDQDGKETPVTWFTTTTACTVDAATGTVTYTNDIYGGGSTSYIYVQATSTLDTNVKSASQRVDATGYQLTSANKTKSAALSEDGQTVKTVSVSGGVASHTVWTTDAPDAVAEWKTQPTKSTSVTLNVYRPGVFHVTEKMDFDEDMTDTATITVTGVAVEGEDGTRGKIYLDEKGTAQLKAYVADGNTVSGWSSSNTAVATVDEKGLVTAVGVGSAIITATDNSNAKGGIKVVVKSDAIPCFEAIEIATNAVSDWKANETFQATKLEYPLTIKTYSTSTLTMQATTLYDTEKYTASAAYTDVNGEAVTIPVNSGKITSLTNIPFGKSDVTVSISSIADTTKKTVYVFHVTRPRDTTKVIKNTTGIVLAPVGRELSTVQYNGKAEGTFFQADESGAATTTATINGTKYNYRAFLIGADEKFALTFTGNTAYSHLRYSADDGTTWTELPQSGGKTEQISFPAVQTGNPVAKVKLQVLDDQTYFTNVSDKKDGFADATPNVYTVWVERINISTDSFGILSASVDTQNADSYPAEFNTNILTNVYVVPNGTSTAELTYTVTEGATVKVGTSATAAGTDQTPEQNGSYKLALGTGAKYINVTKDGVTKQYNFKLQARSAKAYADKLVDFLCINSQYTNGAGTGNAAAPWTTLTGSLSSLGNWGGYITYYFDTPLTDNPNNKYGMDFYAYGNANRDTSTATKMSFFEPGQVWVSEDGETWYALAGSAHYEDDVDWNYTVNYSKAANGKTAWSDNHGNSNDGSSKSGAWVSPSVYYMNDLAKQNQITLKGIMLPSADGTVTGSGTTDAYAIKWGYVDALPNGTVGADTNPYVDNSDFSLSAAGFDLEWAVDQNGIPIDVSEMEFHYVKVVTASNIWHNSFAEKSTESSGVLRTTAQSAAVGKTASPAGVTITDGASVKTVNFSEGKQVYTVDLEDMKYISVTVNGTDDADNVYINNERGQTAEGIKVTKEMGEKLVRIIVQNGDKEPVIYLLKLTSSATSSKDLIEGVKIVADGAGRVASINDGETYTVSVGYRVNSIGIVPIAAPGVEATVSPAGTDGSYALAEGENTFTLTAGEQTVTLIVTRAAEPTSTGKIKVYFTLKGDEKHGETETPHTLKNGGLTTWISRTAITVDSPAVVLDVLEKALDGKYAFVNAGGNYISEINGLAEFTNGARSGWMYTLNGKHAELGVGEQTVRNGDEIVFHYTDDYTAERENERWSNIPVAAEKEPEEKTEAEQFPFTDVSEDAYYRDAAQWAVAGGVTSGTDEKHFSPDAFCTRGQMVTFLWRAAGCPKARGKTPFTDVAPDAYYSEAVAWAYETGITGGTSETTFSPDIVVTRAQVAVFLYRFEKPAAGVGANPFRDVSETAYYYDAVLWAYANGVTGGTGVAVFSPAHACTRGQIVTFLYRAFTTEPSEKSGGEEKLTEAAAYVLKTTPAPRLGSVGGEWAVLGLARCGYTVPADYYSEYYAALEKTVAEAKGVLSTRKYTEYSRVIVALSAIGKDARSVAGYDLTMPLGDYERTIYQGTSGAVWALIALDSRNYPMPVCPGAAVPATRQRYVDRLLETQNTDGGWGIGAAGVSDMDMTAMALQALASYREQKPVAAAVEKALVFLSGKQGIEGATCETTAQILVALSALGIEPEDSRFVKNGQTLLDDLDGYRAGGGYAHIRGGKADPMASEQALYALAALWRAQKGMPGLYNMVK